MNIILIFYFGRCWPPCWSCLFLCFFYTCLLVHARKGCASLLCCVCCVIVQIWGCLILDLFLWHPVRWWLLLCAYIYMLSLDLDYNVDEWCFRSYNNPYFCTIVVEYLYNEYMYINITLFSYCNFWYLEFGWRR